LATPCEIIDYLEYVPSTGQLLWKKLPGNRTNVKVGSEAGTLKDGYRRVGFRGKYYYSHIIIWRICKGLWPTKDLDHKNRNPLDNRIENLRECSKSQNRQNSKHLKHYKGVKFQKGLWHARITINRVQKYLGSFRCETAAALAYNKASKEFFGEFATYNTLGK